MNSIDWEMFEYRMFAQAYIFTMKTSDFSTTNNRNWWRILFDEFSMLLNKIMWLFSKRGWNPLTWKLAPQFYVQSLWSGKKLKLEKGISNHASSILLCTLHKNVDCSGPIVDRFDPKKRAEGIFVFTREPANSDLSIRNIMGLFDFIKFLHSLHRRPLRTWPVVNKG